MKKLKDFEIFDVMTNQELENLKKYREVIKTSDSLISPDKMKKVIFIKKKKRSNNKITFKQQQKNKRLENYGF
jgi:hypothetical protein